MSVLIVAEHDNSALNPNFACAVSAALPLCEGAGATALVLGENCGGVAEQAARVSGVGKVLLREDSALANRFAENAAPVIAAAGKGGGGGGGYGNVVMAAGRVCAGCFAAGGGAGGFAAAGGCHPGRGRGDLRASHLRGQRLGDGADDRRGEVLVGADHGVCAGAQGGGGGGD